MSEIFKFNEINEKKSKPNLKDVYKETTELLQSSIDKLKELQEFLEDLKKELIKLNKESEELTQDLENFTFRLDDMLFYNKNLEDLAQNNTIKIDLEKDRHSSKEIEEITKFIEKTKNDKKINDDYITSYKKLIEKTENKIFSYIRIKEQSKHLVLLLNTNRKAKA